MTKAPISERIKRAPAEMLVETKVTIHDNIVTLRRNLGPLGLSHYVDSVRENEIRALLVGSDIYYWPAFDATHHQVANALGIAFNPDDRIAIRRVGENGAIMVDTAVPADPTQPGLRKIMDSQNMYFDQGTGKWLPGPEYVLARAA